MPASQTLTFAVYTSESNFFPLREVRLPRPNYFDDTGRGFFFWNFDNFANFDFFDYFEGGGREGRVGERFNNFVYLK